MDNYMDNYLEIANSWVMWAAAAPAVVAVIWIAVKYARLSFRQGEALGMEKSQCRSALRSGLIATIGPACAMFTFMIALMAVLGGPFAWMRLSILGTAQTEMIAATVGAQAAGAEIGTPSYTTIPFAVSVWTITLNTLGWSVFVFLFNHRMEKVKIRIDKIDTRLMTMIGLGALIGALAFFASAYGFLKGLAGSVAVLAAMGTSLVIGLIAKKFKLRKLEEFNLGLSMVAGMLLAQLFA